jgi:hypothetical protein
MAPPEISPSSELIQLFDKSARRRDLVGSFGLLAAAAVLTIPYERMKASHFPSRRGKGFGCRGRDRTDRAQLRRLLHRLDAGDVVMVTRLDRLARSIRDLLNTLATITGKKAGVRSLGDTSADTTTPHGRLMLTMLGGLAEFERDLIRSRK